MPFTPDMLAGVMGDSAPADGPSLPEKLLSRPKFKTRLSIWWPSGQIVIKTAPSSRPGLCSRLSEIGDTESSILHPQFRNWLQQHRGRHLYLHSQTPANGGGVGAVDILSFPDCLQMIKNTQRTLTNYLLILSGVFMFVFSKYD